MRMRLRSSVGNSGGASRRRMRLSGCSWSGLITSGMVFFLLLLNDLILLNTYEEVLKSK